MNNQSDIIGNKHIQGGINFSYVHDRHNKLRSATYLNHGFLQLPVGTYFYGDFSITCWMKLKAPQPWVRVIDFGNDRNTDNVLFSSIGSKADLLVASHYSVNERSNFLGQKTHLDLETWYHVAVTLKAELASIYVDGALKEQSTKRILLPRNVLRNHNFIGKTNLDGNQEYAQVVYDDLKIYHGALTNQEVMQQFLD